jgi:hypothetical protein
LWEAGLAEKLDEHVWRDKVVKNIVETQAEAYGQKTQYSLLHPKYLVMVDEVGEKKLQKGDGNDRKLVHGGERHAGAGP